MPAASSQVRQVRSGDSDLFSQLSGAAPGRSQIFGDVHSSNGSHDVVTVKTLKLSYLLQVSQCAPCASREINNTSKNLAPKRFDLIVKYCEASSKNAEGSQ